MRSIVSGRPHVQAATSLGLGHSRTVVRAIYTRNPGRRFARTASAVCRGPPSTKIALGKERRHLTMKLELVTGAAVFPGPGQRAGRRSSRAVLEAPLNSARSVRVKPGESFSAEWLGSSCIPNAGRPGVQAVAFLAGRRVK